MLASFSFSAFLFIIAGGERIIVNLLQKTQQFFIVFTM